MRIGVITPITLLLPRSFNEWEVDASVDDLVTVAQAADRLGYHHLTASEHISVPSDAEPRRGKRYYDALTTLAYLGAVTRNIRLATNMVVLPYHHPLEILKHYGTLDRLTGGRLILGVGVGSLKGEFDTLGHTFEGRGERADDSLRAIKSSWGDREPEYQGTHYSYGNVVVDPTGVQPELPIWVGGRTMRSIRRALEYGEAWVPFLIGPDDVREMLNRAEDTPAWEARDRPLDVGVWPEPALDVIDNSEQILEQAEREKAAGATILNYRFPSRSLSHHLEQMEALVQVLDPDWTKPL
ncbi:MAG: class F420-dependent oxidoreductase [Actinomycetia bacterium]|nr:class F420-dependent oxidoreductase [Actinomycetes bacterium]